MLAESHGDTTRYRLLETVRQYATERLRAAGEESTIRNQHCDWYVEFAEARDPELSTSVEVVPASLDVEQGNLRVALAWALGHEPTLALRLAVALWRYWLARAFFAEGGQWLETVLAAVPEQSVLRGRALLALAVFDLRRGSGRRLAEIGGETVAAHRALSDHAGLALALVADGVLAYMRGQWSESWQRSLEARAAALDSGVDEVEASSAHLQAMVLLSRGELAAARVAFEQARAALARVPLPKQPFFTPLMLGYAIDGAGTASPRLYFEETVLTGPHVNARQAQGYVLCNLAYLARLAGDVDEARLLVGDAVSMFQTLGDRDGEALALNHLGCLHRVRADYRAGRAALEQSLRLRRDIGDRRAIGLTLCNLGVLTAAEGDSARGTRTAARRAGRLPRHGGRAGAGRRRLSPWRACTPRRAMTTARGACWSTSWRSRHRSPATTVRPPGRTPCSATCITGWASPTWPPEPWPRPVTCSGPSVRSTVRSGPHGARVAAKRS